MKSNKFKNGSGKAKVSKNYSAIRKQLFKKNTRNHSIGSNIIQCQGKPTRDFSITSMALLTFYKFFM